MSEIDRHCDMRARTGKTALELVGFCLDQLEKTRTLKWEATVGTRLTVEEITGALIAAENELVVAEKEENP